MEIVITGAGLISPLGDDAGALHDALLDGRSGLASITLFPTDGLSGTLAGEVAGFDANAYLGNTNLRPLDRPARLAAAAAGRALADAGWIAPPDDASDETATDAEARRIGDRTGLVLGTMFGSLRTIAEFDRRAMSAGPSYASPLDFANSVINAAAGQAAIWHELPGVNATIAGGPTAGVVALGFAADQIRSGRADRLLAGGVEELCFEALLGFGRLGLLSASGNPRPFDRHRDGLALGEGAAFLALESAASAAARGVLPRALVLGHGEAFDPSRGADPASASGALVRAIRAALAESALEAAAVDAVSVSASGLPGDRHEAAALHAVFGDRLAEMPIVAIKGALGESLGAAGAFQALALLTGIATGRLPGVASLRDVDLGSGLAASHAGNRDLRLRVGLVTARGFDGQAAALVLSAPAAPAAASGVLPSGVLPSVVPPIAEKAA